MLLQANVPINPSTPLAIPAPLLNPNPPDTLTISHTCPLLSSTLMTPRHQMSWAPPSTPCPHLSALHASYVGQYTPCT